MSIEKIAAHEIKKISKKIKIEFWLLAALNEMMQQVKHIYYHLCNIQHIRSKTIPYKSFSYYYRIN